MANKGRQQKKNTSYPVAAVFFLLLLAVPVLSALFASFGPERTNPGRADFAGEKVKGGDSVDRGNIYDRRYNRLAVSVPLCSIYARPLEIDATEEKRDQLAGLLGQEPETLRRNLRSERSFVWIGRNLPQPLAREVEALGIKGVYIERQAERYYPEARAAAHAVGFFREGHGLGGVEFHYDRLLRGEQTPAGSQTVLEDRPNRPVHVVLSLDVSLQRKVDEELAAIMEKTGARSAAGMVLEPSSGEILALVNLPSFDPNRFWEFNEQLLGNSLLSQPVYPGALNALFKLAATIDGGGQAIAAPTAEKKGEADIWEEKEPGVYALGAMPAVAEQSPKQETYATLLGLDSRAAIDLPGVNSALHQQGYRLSDNFSATSAAGLARAFAALVNGGRLVAPHLLLKTIADGAGEAVEAPAPGPQQILTAEAGDRLREAMAADKSKRLFFAQSAVSLEMANARQAGTTKGEDGGAMEPGSGVNPARPIDGYQVVLVAAAPVDKPQAAMVLVLSGVRAPVSLRQTAEAALRRAMTSVAVSRPFPSAEALAGDAGAMYQEWLKINGGAVDERGANHAATATVAAVMPELKGLSLRKAMQTLQPYNLELAVVGNGRVVAQEPAAGKNIGGGNCTLRLKPDGAKK